MRNSSRIKAKYLNKRKKFLVNGLIAEIRMKDNAARDTIQINRKIIKKFIFMLDELFVKKPKIKIAIFYNPQKHKAILDFLLNKFQKRSSLIWRLDFFGEVLSLFKSYGLTYHQGVNSKFNYKKKYIIKINSFKDDKKLIKWRNEIKLDNKFKHLYSITTIKKKIEYMIFKVILNEGKNSLFRRKAILLGYKVLELRIVSFWEKSLGSSKKCDLKLFNKFVFKGL